MIKFACFSLLLACACCHAQEVEEDFPHYEGVQEKTFLLTVTQHIHAYKSEDRLMMEKKSPAVRPLATPKAIPSALKVKMLAQPKNKFWQDPRTQNLKYRLQLSAKRPF